MSTYLELVNIVLENLRWEPTSATSWDAPDDPVPAIKRFVNEAKDEVLARIGGRLIQKEFLFETNRAVTYANSGNIALSYAGGQAVIAGGLLFASWMEGAKLKMPTVAFDQTDLPTGDGLTDSTWKRITTVQSELLVNIDSSFSSDASSVTDWTIFRDEYNLDSTVRQVLSAWTNNGPLELDFVSNVAELEMIYPGTTTLGRPQRIAILRSADTDFLWTARLYPAPEEREVVRYQARYRLADLSEPTDEWPLEPEILTHITDRAMTKALQTPIQNDPDLALVNGRDLSQRLTAWQDEYAPVDPNRRMRRRGAGETGRAPVVNARVRWTQ